MWGTTQGTSQQTLQLQQKVSCKWEFQVFHAVVAHLIIRDESAGSIILHVHITRPETRPALVISEHAK